MVCVRSWPRHPLNINNTIGTYLLYRRLVGSLLAGLLPISLAMAGSLEQYFVNLKTLKANFTQSLVQGEGKSKKMHGILYIKSPNQFRLDYTDPYVQIYVADGKKLWQYDADLEQVIIKPQGQILANLPIIVLSNTKKLQENYHVEAGMVKIGTC